MANGIQLNFFKKTKEKKQNKGATIAQMSLLRQTTLKLDWQGDASERSIESI